MSAGAAIGHPAVVGRDDVLAGCTDAVDRTIAGDGGLLLITGEPGIGKTTVAQAAATYARSQGCVVRWSACPEDDAVPAFWPFVRLVSNSPDSALAPLAAELLGTIGSEGESRFLLFDRVATALYEAGASAPHRVRNCRRGGVRSCMRGWPTHLPLGVVQMRPDWRRWHATGSTRAHKGAATRGVDAAERAGRHRAFEQAADDFTRAIEACVDAERAAVLHPATG